MAAPHGAAGLSGLGWLLCLSLVAASSALCPGQSGLAENPSDPAARGPYPVGAVLGSIAVRDGRFGLRRTITVEAWYPAPPGSDLGKDPLAYDIRQHIPAEQRAKLKDAANVTRQPCDCYRDLPIADGPFPVVLMIHGFAAFRTASLHQQTHWASRGFVVVAADHPGIQLLDLLGVTDGHVLPKRNQEGDARAILAALSRLPASAPSLGRLAGHLDLGRLAVVGHSAGGFACDQLGDVADVLIPMSGFSPRPGPRVKSTLVLGARNDTIATYRREVGSYENSTVVPRRFASVDALGHLFCTDLCWIGASAGGVVQIAVAHGIKVARFFESLGQNGCAYLNKPDGARFLNPQCGWLFVNYASSAALEEVLRCDASMAGRLSRMQTELPSQPGCPSGIVFDYRQQLASPDIIV